LSNFLSALSTISVATIPEIVDKAERKFDKWRPKVGAE